MINPVDVEALFNRLLGELETFLKDNDVEAALAFVKGRLESSGCQSLQSELAISRLVLDMINTWQPKHGCALLRALVVFTSAVPNGVSESSVRTATRYVAENAKLDHNRDDLRMVAEAIAQFLRVYPHPFPTRHLQDLLYLECDDTFYIALEVAPILLGQNQKSTNRVPLREVIDALFSRKESKKLSEAERTRIAKKIAYSMTIEYWGENLAELESQPVEEYGNWSPRANFLTILLLGHVPVLGVFPMHNENRTILAFSEKVTAELESGSPAMDVISSVGARLEESSDQEYNPSPNPIQKLFIDAITNTSNWKNRQASKNTVVNLDDFRQNDEGNES